MPRKCLCKPPSRFGVPQFKKQPVRRPPPVPLDDCHPIYCHLKDFGIPNLNEDELQRSAERLSWAIDTGIDVKFPISLEEKEEALQEWGKESILQSMAAAGFEFGEFSPLCWDDYMATALVLYRERDKSFWTWDFKVLRKVGHRWTDLVLPWFVF
jgi:hypothetical protein